MTAKAQRIVEHAIEIQYAEDVKRHLGKVQTLANFRRTEGGLTLAERRTIVEQALLVIEQIYVHLPLKRAMHAIDPVQRLRLVMQRLDGYSDRAFHNEMIAIFVHLRDLHTNYILPEPYSSRVAFLPFHVEEYFEPAGAGKEPERRYVVTEVVEGLSDRKFKAGVLVTHWNGVPMDAAVEVNAEREAGSNLDARHLKGLQSITLRWMATSLPPDEDWVVVRYLPDDGKDPPREARFDWQVIIPPPPSGSEGTVLGRGQGAAGKSRMRPLGIDPKGEIQRRVRKLLFAPKAVAAQQKMDDLGAGAGVAARAFHTQVMRAATATATPLAPELGAAPRRRPATSTVSRAARGPRPGPAAVAAGLASEAMLDGVDLTANSIMPDVFKQFGKVTGPNGTFGYIRIVTFWMKQDKIEEFVREFIRIIALLPQEGLIVDVRGNTGGWIEAGERLLQTLTAGSIEPERFQMINTPLVQKLCEHDEDFGRWTDTVKQGIETGATFSQGLPLTFVDDCNSIGQTYQGPVVLIVDAGCYSTTDIFAAGFQDHDIGVVLGTSGHTGAGGANVEEHVRLSKILPGGSSPLKPLPGGAAISVAIRRSARVGERWGETLEDLGVIPRPPIYHMTRNDVLNHNVDLIAHACGILAGRPRQRLTATCSRRADGSLDVTLTTSNLQRVDVLLDWRPVHTLDVKDGSVSFSLPPPSSLGPGGGAATELQCQGFRDGELFASTRVRL